jgi:hypothetical protein
MALRDSGTPFGPAQKEKAAIAVTAAFGVSLFFRGPIRGSER